MRPCGCGGSAGEGDLEELTNHPAKQTTASAIGSFGVNPGGVMPMGLMNGGEPVLVAAEGAQEVQGLCKKEQQQGVERAPIFVFGMGPPSSGRALEGKQALP
jgi:hypothetical protein